MSTRPFFSIIIPSLNEEKYLPKLLEDLSNQTLQDFEVIVVDGNSEDKTIQLIEKYKDIFSAFKIIISKIRNVSVQRNLGGKNAIGKYLVFNDADNRLPVYFLEGLRYQLRVNPVDLFTCWCETDYKNSKDKTIATACNLLLEANKLTNTPSAFGAMIGCKTDIFSKTPMFNPEVGFAEDTDFVRKSAELGYSFEVFKDPRYSYSLRRFHSQGTVKVIQKSAKLFLKYLSGKNINQEIEYPMGGKNNVTKNQDLIQKINHFLNKPIKKPKIVERLQSLLEFEE